MLMTWSEDHHSAKKYASIYNQLLRMPCVWSNAGMTFKHNYTSTVLVLLHVRVFSKTDFQKDPTQQI